MRTKVLKFLTRVRPNIRCRAVTLLLLVSYHQDIRIWWWHDTMTWWHDDVGIHLVGVGSCLHEWQTSILNQKPSPTTIISEIFSHFHTLGVNLPLSVFFSSGIVTLVEKVFLPHHSDEMSERSQVSTDALWRLRGADTVELCKCPGQERRTTDWLTDQGNC